MLAANERHFLPTLDDVFGPDLEAEFDAARAFLKELTELDDRFPGEVDSITMWEAMDGERAAYHAYQRSRDFVGSCKQAALLDVFTRWNDGYDDPSTDQLLAEFEDEDFGEFPPLPPPLGPDAERTFHSRGFVHFPLIHIFTLIKLDSTKRRCIEAIRRGLAALATFLLVAGRRCVASILDALAALIESPGISVDGEPSRTAMDLIGELLSPRVLAAGGGQGLFILRI